MKHRYVNAIVVFIALAVLLGCGQKEGQASAAPGGPPAMRVKMVKAELQPVGQYTEYLATLKSRSSAVLHPEVEGQITRIFVKSGDHVEPGTPIIEIDPRKQQATLHSQEANRRSKSANLEWAKTELERRKKLAAAGVISRQDLEQAQTQYDAAKADVEASEATVREQHVQLRYYTVKAPSVGVIGDIPVRVGDRVATTTELTTVDKRGALEAYISVPSEKSGEVKVGTPVQIVDDSGKSTVTTKVSFVSPRVDPATQLLLVKAEIPNGNGQFRNDQSVHVRVVFSKEQRVLIPVTSVVRLSGQPFVYIAEGNGNQMVAKQRKVELGDIQGNNYVVLGGVNPGEQMIVTGTMMLADGAPVAPES